MGVSSFFFPWALLEFGGNEIYWPPEEERNKKTNQSKNRIQKPKEKWEIPTKKGGHRKSPKTNEPRPEKRLAPPKIA